MPYQRYSIPIPYRVARAMCRCFFWLVSRDIRLLNTGSLEQFECASLVIDRPAGILPALALVCVFDERVQCLFPASQSPRTFSEKLLAWAFGIKTFDATIASGEAPNHDAIAAAHAATIIAVFMRDPQGASSNAAARADFVAELAALHPLGPEIFPVHWLSPTGIRGPEFVNIGRPFSSSSGADDPTAVADGSPQSKMTQNVFALEPGELECFSRDLEEMLRESLRDEWSQIPGWRQSADEMILSGFTRRWIAERNRTDPGFLVSLRESADRCRELRRRANLQRLRTDATGPWSRSHSTMALAWIESIFGFPVALYGLLNHVPAAAALIAGGLLKKESRRDPKTQWLLRIFIVLGFYTLQTWLIDVWLGRVAAGWYALLLPITGAYLWRYHWLIEHRTYALALRFSLPLSVRRAVRQQRGVRARLEREFSRYAPHQYF